MTEEIYRKWDVVAKLIAPVLTVLGLLIGINQFGREQENIRTRELALVAKNDTLEFKRRVWDRQLTAYMGTAKAVGDIVVVAENPAKLKGAIDRFYQLYWGNMILFEDAAARKSMVRFRIELQDYRRGESSRDRLKIRAAMLVDDLRASSHASWTNLNKPK